MLCYGTLLGIFESEMSTENFSSLENHFYQKYPRYDGEPKFSTQKSKIHPKNRACYRYDKGLVR